MGLPVKDYTLGTLEERIIIYADRLVDIITEKIVPIKTEKEAEDRFEEILKTIPKYGKNDITLERYLGYHREIQNLPGVCPLLRQGGTAETIRLQPYLPLKHIKFF